jgi:phospholipid/cholesterol/gamma-HCH transport system ATP-binding protein
MGMLVKLIRLLNDSLGLTSVLVSHDVAESASISDHLIILADGKVIGQGTPSQLKNSDSELVRQFMNGLPDGPVPFHYPAQTFGNDLLNL